MLKEAHRQDAGDPLMISNPYIGRDDLSGLKDEGDGCLAKKGGRGWGGKVGSPLCC